MHASMINAETKETLGQEFEVLVVTLYGFVHIDLRHEFALRHAIVEAPHKQSFKASLQYVEIG